MSRESASSDFGAAVARDSAPHSVEEPDQGTGSRPLQLQALSHGELFTQSAYTRAEMGTEPVFRKVAFQPLAARSGTLL